ncbi:MAG: ribonuclease HII [Ferrimicrobium sp.]
MIVVGMDEVGRGAWAGPVTVGVAGGDLDFLTSVLGAKRAGAFRDSKSWNEVEREAVWSILVSGPMIGGVGHAGHDEVDRLGLSGALALAARRALDTVGCVGAIMLDGSHNYLGDHRVVTVVGGDVQDAMIAAASIFAKVARDRLVRELSVIYPYWDFEHCKGYPTERHRFGLAGYGPSAIHRRSYRPLRRLSEDRGIPSSHPSHHRGYNRSE